MLIANLHSATNLSIFYTWERWERIGKVSRYCVMLMKHENQLENWEKCYILASPRAFYCIKMCEKSKSTTFSYYEKKLRKVLHIIHLAQLLWRGQKVAAAHQIQLQHTWQKTYMFSKTELILIIKIWKFSHSIFCRHMYIGCKKALIRWLRL